MPWLLKVWHFTNNGWCVTYLTCHGSPWCVASCCLDNLETRLAFLSTAYILRSALNKPTNIPVNHLTSITMIYFIKANQNFIQNIQTSVASEMQNCSTFLLSIWPSSAIGKHDLAFFIFLFFIVLQERLYIIIFLNAYFHHWNLIRKY